MSGLRGSNYVKVFLAQMIAECNNVRTKQVSRPGLWVLPGSAAWLHCAATPQGVVVIFRRSDANAQRARRLAGQLHCPLHGSMRVA